MNTNPPKSERVEEPSILMTLAKILFAVLLGLLGFAGTSAVVDGRW